MSNIIMYDDEFLVMSTDSLKGFNEEFIRYTKERYDMYKDFFGVDTFRKLSFVLFDNLDDYRKDYIDRNQNEPPSYSRGNFTHNGAYICIDQELIPGTNFFNKKRASGAHEAFHIFYRELVYGKIMKGELYGLMKEWHNFFRGKETLWVKKDLRNFILNLKEIISQ